jgi:predicted NAD/FAD-binding protein
MRIAIIGSGISGLVAAHLLNDEHEITLYEADPRPGGHTNTVRVDLSDATVHVDTGFLVYNELTYPNFVRLLTRLGIPTKPSDMSFSMSDAAAGIEWRGTSIATVFAQPRNALRPAFLRMLADVGRFNRKAVRLLDEPPGPDVSLLDFLDEGSWSTGFFEWYLQPIGSAIWSVPPSEFLRMPAARFARFFARHGLLTPSHQPRWRTVDGGADGYVEAIVAPLRAAGRLRLATPVQKLRRSSEGVEIWNPQSGPETYDHVVLATHSDQAMRLLSDPSRGELEVLRAVRYQPNQATLHTDDSLMPTRRRAWASWNYHRLPDHAGSEHPARSATLTYHLNSLQGLSCREQLFVTLNREADIDPSKVIASFDYAHPVLDAPAATAQGRIDELAGGRLSFCGAWLGDGFHEDGVNSALEVCARLGKTL